MISESNLSDNRCAIIKGISGVDFTAAIVGLYAQIKSGDATVRDKCFKFLQVKLKDLGPEIITVDFEKRLLSETKRILPVCTLY